jgi:FkbM family methyltransferase
MKLSAKAGELLLGAYPLVKRSGILGTSLGRWSFRSAYFLYKRYIEDDLRDLLLAFPSMVCGGDVLDIGANLGYTATVLAEAIEPGRRIYAFEPEAFNFKILEQIALQPKFKDKMIALPYAVGAENGSVHLWMNPGHHADHRIATQKFHSEHPDFRGTAVDMVRIDSFLESRPGNISFVKIDVQGYELAVCQGMEDTLRHNPDIAVVLEFMPSLMREMGFDPSQLIDFFVARNFKIYLVHPRGKLTQGLPTARNDSDYFDLLFTRRPMACDGES